MIKIEFVTKLNKTIKLTIDDSNLDFINGYALINRDLSEAEIKTTSLWGTKKKSIKGVINTSGKTIIPFQDYYDNIDIFTNDNFIVTSKPDLDSLMVSETKNIHYHYNGIELVKINEIPGKYYTKINEDKIIINSKNMDDSFEAIYSLENGKIISNKFTSIKDFEDINGIKVALATKDLSVNGMNASIYCYIDTNGNIRTPLYNSFTNNYIDTTQNEFNYDKYIENTIYLLSNQKEKVNEDIKNLKTMIK